MPDIKQTRSDEELAKDISRRKPETFEYFYQQYAGIFLAEIRRVLLSENVSEETLMTTFVAIWKSIDEYDPAREPFLLWATKKLHKEIRTKKREIVLSYLFPPNNSK